MSGFQWVKWVSAQVNRSWWVSVRQPAERAELGIDLATARLDAEDVDQFLVGLDQAGLDRDGPAEGGLGFPDAAALPLDPAGQQVGLGGDRVIVGDPVDRGEGLVEVPFRGGELGFQHPVQPGLRAQPLEGVQRVLGRGPNGPARNARSASAQRRSGSGRLARSSQPAPTPPTTSTARMTTNRPQAHRRVGAARLTGRDPDRSTPRHSRGSRAIEDGRLLPLT